MRENQPPAIGASPVANAIQSITAPWGERTWLRTYCVGIAAAVFLSFVGANDTSDVPVLMRLGYWLVAMLGGTLIVQAVALVADRWLLLEPLAEAVAMFGLATGPILIFIWWVTSAYTGNAPDPATLPHFFVPVVVITSAMSALHYFLNRDPKQSHEFHPQTVHATTPGHAFRERLPFKYRHADIYALSAEDHYLRVHTSAGETLILMRLYDAIRELDGIEGSQTHRSWWVAKDAVADVTRRDGRVVLALKNATTAPVSRGYVKALKQDGWL